MILKLLMTPVPKCQSSGNNAFALEAFGFQILTKQVLFLVNLLIQVVVASSFVPEALLVLDVHVHPAPPKVRLRCLYL